MEKQDKEIVELTRQIAVKCEAMDVEENKWNYFFLDRIEVYLGRNQYRAVKFNIGEKQYIEVEHDSPHTPGTFLQTFGVTSEMKDRLIENVKKILSWK